MSFRWDRDPMCCFLCEDVIDDITPGINGSEVIFAREIFWFGWFFKFSCIWGSAALLLANESMTQARLQIGKQENQFKPLCPKIIRRHGDDLGWFSLSSRLGVIVTRS